MHTLIMFNSNHCQFILTIYQQLYNKKTKANALALIYQSIWLGFHVLSIIKGATTMTPIQCPYAEPIGGLTNTYTSQNTTHKKGFNVNILCAQETNCEFYKETLKCNFNMKKTLYSELDDYPTLLSNISFHSNLRIHYVDVTCPQAGTGTQAKAQPYHSWHSNVGYSLNC